MRASGEPSNAPKHRREETLSPPAAAPSAPVVSNITRRGLDTRKTEEIPGRYRRRGAAGRAQRTPAPAPPADILSGTARKRKTGKHAGPAASSSRASRVTAGQRPRLAELSEELSRGFVSDRVVTVTSAGRRRRRSPYPGPGRRAGRPCGRIRPPGPWRGRTPRRSSGRTCGAGEGRTG